MAITFTQNDSVPLAPGATVMTPRVKEDYFFSSRTWYDDTWPTDPSRPMVIYFHGSGGGAHIQSTSPIVQTIVGLGAVCVTAMYFNSGTSSEPPFATSYGLVNAPLHYQRMIRNAWYAEAFISFMSEETEGPIFLMGHSQGAIASLTWSSLSGSVGFSEPGLVQGILANGFLAGGGRGGYRWNSPDQQILYGSRTLAEVQHRTIACFADNDEYSPPDLYRRYQQELPLGSPVYVVSPGTRQGGHNWMTQGNAPTIWGPWLKSLIDDTPVLVEGLPAISGPVI